MIILEIKKIIRQKLFILFSILFALIIIFSNGKFVSESISPSFNVLGVYTYVTGCHDNELNLGEDELSLQTCQAIKNQDFNFFLSAYKQRMLDISRNRGLYQDNLTISYIDYLTDHGLDKQFNSSTYIKNLGNGAMEKLINSIFANSFYIIPLFIVIVTSMFINIHDKTALLQSSSRFRIFLSKVFAVSILCFLTIVISFITAYLYFGMKYGFYDLRLPYIIVDRTIIELFGLPNITYVSGYVFFLLIIIIQGLYTLFLSLLVNTIRIHIDNKFIVLTVSIFIILGVYFIRYQSFLLDGIGHLLPFTYGNPIIALQGELLVIYALKRSPTVASPFGKELGKYVSNPKVYIGNGFIILIVSIILCGLIARYLVNRKDFLI